MVEGQCILAVTGYLAVGWVGKPETPSDIGGAIDGIEPIHMCFCTSDCHLAQVYVSGESQGCAWRVRVLCMIVRMIRRYGVMGNDGPSGRTLQSMAKQSKKSVQYGLIKRVQVNNQITLASVYLGVCRHMIALTKASFYVVLSSSRLVV